MGWGPASPLLLRVSGLMPGPPLSTSLGLLPQMAGVPMSPIAVPAVGVPAGAARVLTLRRQGAPAGVAAWEMEDGFPPGRSFESQCVIRGSSRECGSAPKVPASVRFCRKPSLDSCGSSPKRAREVCWRGGPRKTKGPGPPRPSSSSPLTRRAPPSRRSTERLVRKVALVEELPGPASASSP